MGKAVIHTPSGAAARPPQVLVLEQYDMALVLRPDANSPDDHDALHGDRLGGSISDRPKSVRVPAGFGSSTASPGA
jgi:hypothetical protein